MGLRPPINLADFFKSLQYLGATGNTSRILRLLGFEIKEEHPSSDVGGRPPTPSEPKDEVISSEEVVSEVPTGANEAWAEIKALAVRGKVPDWFAAVPPLPQTRGTEGLPQLPREPLLEPRWTRAILQTALSRDNDDGELDLDRVVETLASKRQLGRLPRKQRRHLNNRVQVIIDTGETMTPYEGDKAQLLGSLRSTLPDDILTIVYSDGCPLVPSDADSEYRLPHQGSTVLLLSDVGLGVARPFTHHQTSWWRKFLKVLHVRGCLAVVFLPYDLSRVPASFRRLATFVPWRPETTSSQVRQLRKTHEWLRGAH